MFSILALDHLVSRFPSFTFSALKSSVSLPDAVTEALTARFETTAVPSFSTPFKAVISLILVYPVMLFSLNTSFTNFAPSGFSKTI